jgi:hypothetical protein
VLGLGCLSGLAIGFESEQQIDNASGAWVGQLGITFKA